MTKFQHVSIGKFKAFHFPREPRPSFDDHIGIYLLLGPGSGTKKLPELYVGEGIVQNELRLYGENQDNQKPFWTKGIAIIANKRKLSKKLVERLEAKLIEIARLEHDAGNYRLHNIHLNFPGRRWYLGDQKDLDNILECLRKLGVNFSEKPGSQTVKNRGSYKTTKRNNFTQTEGNGRNFRIRENILRLEGKGVEAHGHESGMGFAVLKGSQAVSHQARSCPLSISNLRKALRRKGILDSRFRFTRDHTFNSRSQASKVIWGNSNDGSRWE